MSDQNPDSHTRLDVLTSSTPTPVPTPVPQTPAQQLLSQVLSSDVKTAIAAKPTEPYDRVVAALAEAEVAKRSEKLKTGFDKVNSLNADKRKIKPAIAETYSLDGKVATAASYSKEQIKEVGELDQKINKLESALSDAVTKSDYSKLNDLLK